MDNNNKQNQNSNWQTITMLVIAALLTILIVGWMNSTVNARQRQELSYNEFVNMVENGKVESISVGSTIIEVKPKADDTNYSQQMKYYPELLEELRMALDMLEQQVLSPGMLSAKTQIMKKIKRSLRKFGK